MKVDKTNSAQPGKPIRDGATQTSNKGKAQTSNKGKAGSSPAQRQDTTSVSLGSAATQLHSIESSMASSPVADSAKVAEIKQAISDGRFKVNSEVVANRLLQTVFDLLGRKA